MSWLFSQALVEAYSGASSSGGEPCAPLSVMPTPHKFWRNDKTMEPCDLSRFGLTCAVLTAARGEELLTSFLAAFPARTSARPARGRGLKAKGRDSGKSSPGSFAKYDRNSCSWKTAQYSLLGGLMLFSGIWPKWGSMRNGAVSARQMPSGLAELRQLITSESASGSVESLPTPLAHDVRPQGMARQIVNGRLQAANGGGSVGLTLATLVTRVPTPRAADGRHGAVTATSTTSRRVETGQANLAEFVVERPQRLPTPKSRDWKGQSQRGIDGPMDSIANLDRGDGSPIGGSLNPNWEEWLMGWPIGWTASEPLETDRFREWWHSHGESYEADLTTFNK